MRQKALQKRSSPGWKVPRVVSRSDVRPHLAAIVRHVATGNDVLVGTSEKLAFSAFIPAANFETQRTSYRAAPRDIDIEVLRQNWSKEREQVENTGGPLVILRKGEPVAALVPTERALERKVPQTLATLAMSHIDLLQEINQRVTTLETNVGALAKATFSPENLREMRQTMGLARVVLKLWRDKQGYEGNPPAEPPASSV